MTAAELLAIAALAARIANTGLSIYSRLDGRDLTPEELAEIKAAQGEAEDRWADTLKKLREE